MVRTLLWVLGFNLLPAALCLAPGAWPIRDLILSALVAPPLALVGLAYVAKVAGPSFDPCMAITLALPIFMMFPWFMIAGLCNELSRASLEEEMNVVMVGKRGR
jgi:hypothetical protein